MVRNPDFQHSLAPRAVFAGKCRQIALKLAYLSVAVTFRSSFECACLLGQNKRPNVHLSTLLVITIIMERTVFTYQTENKNINLICYVPEKIVEPNPEKVVHWIGTHIHIHSIQKTWTRRSDAQQTVKAERESESCRIDLNIYRKWTRTRSLFDYDEVI